MPDVVQHDEQLQEDCSCAPNLWKGRRHELQRRIVVDERVTDVVGRAEQKSPWNDVQCSISKRTLFMWKMA
jgi:hypothetical protein